MTAGGTLIGSQHDIVARDARTDTEQHANSMACVAEHMQLVLNGATFNARNPLTH